MNCDAIITSDIHLRVSNPKSRTDDYLSALKRKLLFVKKLASENGCPVIDGGDLFNNWRSTPLIESWAINQLPQPFMTVIGNHEMPYHNVNYFAKSSLKVLLSAKTILLPEDNGLIDIIFSHNNIEFEVFGLNYRTRNKGFDVTNKKTKKVLILHDMITKKKDTRFESYTANEIFEKFPDFDLIVTGHNHDSFMVESEGRILLNPGSLMRSSSAQIDYQPRVFKWFAKENKIEPVNIPIESADKVFNIEFIESRKLNDNRLENFVNNFDTNYETDISFEKNLDMFYKKNKTRQGIKKIIQEALV